MRVDKTTPMCELCTKSVGCTCGDAGANDCKFEIMNKEDTMKAIFIANEVSSQEGNDGLYPSPVRKNMMRKFYLHHGGTMYDIVKYGFYHELCNECEGSGVNIGVTIERCKNCGGKGVIEKPIDSNYNEIWMYYTVENGFAGADVQLLGFSRTEEEATKSAKNVGAKYGSILFHKRLGDVVDLFNQDREFVAMSSINHEIITAGNWEDIHRYFGIAEWQDIETFFDGSIQVMPKNDFNNMYEVNTVAFMSELYVHVISDIMMQYVYSASYKEAPELWSKYVGVFDTLTKIHDNIGKHAATDDPIMVMGDDLELLNKVCNDFRLIGMVINQNAAANIVRRIQSVVNNNAGVISSLTNFNAVAVFITEYIMISAEYATITED